MMFKERTPRWILTGGFLLSFGAGAVNAVGFIGVHHQGLSHVTGTVSLVSTHLASGLVRDAATAALVVGSFFAGAFLSGFIIVQSTLRVGRRYGVALTIEAVLLAASAWCFQRGLLAGSCLASAACGLQNAMASSYSGAVVRSTHLTGMVTDLGLEFGHALRGRAVDWFRLRLYAAVLGGFLTGGIAGAFGFLHHGYAMLYFPAALSGATGLSYALYKHRERVRGGGR